MKILKYIIIFLLTILFLEVFLRILKPTALQYYWVQRQIHSFDPDYFVDLEPNQKVNIKHFLGIFNINFTTNERGYRATREVNNSFPQIICIGDSITMGFGVNDEDTFCNKLDLYKDSKENIYQSINLAVDAYGPSAIALKLKKHLPNLNPKLLYYFPSTGDDVDEISFHEKKQNPSLQRAFKIQFLLTKYSYLFLALKVTQEQMQFRFMEAFVYPFIRAKNLYLCMTAQKPKDECPISSWKEILNDLYSDFFRPPVKNPNAYPNFPASECEEPQEEFVAPESAYKAIQEIIDLSKELNLKLVMILLPIDIETAYCSQKGKIHRYYGYLKTMKKFLDKKKIDYIDMNLPQYTLQMVDETGQLNPRPYYIIGDGHYTRLGNDWVFKTLIQKTKEVLP